MSPPTLPTAGEQARTVLVVLAQLVLGRRDPHPGWVSDTALVLAVVVLAATLAVLVRPFGTWPTSAALALPLPLQIALLSVLSVLQGTQLLYERYLHPVVPLAVVATWVWVAALHRRLRRGRPLEDEQVVQTQLEGPVQR